MDYYPPDNPELGARSYVSPDLYLDLAAPLVELAGVDIEAFGSRADLIKRAIWRWIRKTARAHAKEYWELLLVSRNRTLVLAEFSEVFASGRFPKGPKYEPANPVSVVQYGHWLIREQAKSDPQPIIPVIWGLALICAMWRGKAGRGYCKFCYRHAYPGGRFCHFHRQGGIAHDERSKAYIRYRKGRLATALDEEQNGKSRSFVKSNIMDFGAGKQSLAEILFPTFSMDGWETEREELIGALRSAPRVLKEIGGELTLDLPYEGIVERLRQYIDPYKFDDFMWWATVWHAEQWFLLEAIVSPGKRGKGKKTQALVAKAVELKNDGYQNGAIATLLGVAPSTVSSWRRRYPEFG